MGLGSGRTLLGRSGRRPVAKCPPSLISLVFAGALAEADAGAATVLVDELDASFLKRASHGVNCQSPSHREAIGLLKPLDGPAPPIAAFAALF